MADPQTAFDYVGLPPEQQRQLSRETGRRLQRESDAAMLMQATTAPQFEGPGRLLERESQEGAKQLGENAKEALTAQHQAERDKSDDWYKRQEIALGYAKLKALKDKLNDPKLKPISDRVLVQLQGTQEMKESANDLEALAARVGGITTGFRGVRAALTPGNIDTDAFEKALNKAAEAEAKAVKGVSPAKGEELMFRMKINPYTSTPESIKAAAQEIRRRAAQREETVNTLFSTQPNKVPPTFPQSTGPTVAPGAPPVGSAPQPQTGMPRPAPPGHIRVREKASGRTGSLPEAEFNPQLYDRLPQ